MVDEPYDTTLVVGITLIFAYFILARCGRPSYKPVHSTFGVCPQVKSGTGRRWLVSQTTGGTGCPGMASGGLQDGAHGHGHTDARPVRQRARTRVRRRVHGGVLEAGAGRMETVQEMGRQTGERSIVFE